MTKRRFNFFLNILTFFFFFDFITQLGMVNLCTDSFARIYEYKSPNNEQPLTHFVFQSSMINPNLKRPCRKHIGYCYSCTKCVSPI